MTSPDLRSAFRRAKKYALATAETERVTIADSAAQVIVDAEIPLATPAALVALKVVSIVGRPDGNSPHKIGSDIHDLVRLTQAHGALSIAEPLSAAGELGRWVTDTINRLFGKDLSYTVRRLRTYDQSAGAQALTDADVEATLVLAAAIADLQ